MVLLYTVELNVNFRVTLLKRSSLAFIELVCIHAALGFLNIHAHAASVVLF